MSEEARTAIADRAGRAQKRARDADERGDQVAAAIHWRVVRSHVDALKRLRIARELEWAHPGNRELRDELWELDGLLADLARALRPHAVPADEAPEQLWQVVEVLRRSLGDGELATGLGERGIGPDRVDLAFDVLEDRRRLRREEPSEP